MPRKSGARASTSRTPKIKAVDSARAPQRARRRAEPDESKLNRSEELLIAAFDLFAERNFASVTIKDIGAAINVNTALIYYYFGNKEDLFRASIEMAVDRAFQHFRLLRERRSSPPEIIAGWLENHVVLHELIQKLVKIGLDYASTGRRVAGIDRSIRRFYDDETAAVSAAILDGMKLGLFVKGDADKLVTFISTHLDGVMVRSAIFPDFDVKKAVVHLQAIVWAQLGYTAKRR